MAWSLLTLEAPIKSNSAHPSTQRPSGKGTPQMTLRQTLLATALAAPLALSAFAANATVMSITLSESGFADNVTSNSGIGAISVGPISYGNFSVNQVSAQDQSVLAIPGILNSNTLNISAAGSSASTLTIDVKSAGLIGFNTALGKSSFTVNALNGSVINVIETTLINGVQLATTGVLTGLGTSVQNDLVDLGPGGTFTADEVYTITTSGGIGNANLTIDLSGAPVPEPASLALLGGGLFGIGFVTRRKLRA
jgi:PEP-CTERM motif